MAKRDVYMNPMQQRIFYAGARHIRVRAARRFGKTDGVAGPQAGRVVQSMPRGIGIWCGNSNRQLLARTAPATISAMQRFWGFQEGRHYWWGQPPAKLNIPKPIIAPKDWSKCITFYNGFVWHLVSLETRGSANSLTSNYILQDEARFVKKEKLDAEVMPTLSGVTHPLGDKAFSDENPWYKGTLFISDAGLSTRESWMEKEEAKCDIPIEEGMFKGKTSRELQEELDHYGDRVMWWNDFLRRAKMTAHQVRVVSPEDMLKVKELVRKYKLKEGKWRIVGNQSICKNSCEMLVNYHIITPEEAELLYDHEFLITPEQHFELRVLRNSKQYEQRIRNLRCNTFAYYEASTLDNIDLLGIEYIQRMKRDLPPLIFALSILNMKKVKSNDGFYSLLDIENIHGYTPEMPESVLDRSIRRKIASTVVGGQAINTDYESPDFDVLQSIKDCSLDGDVLDDDDLYIALDYNANINWVVTGKIGENERGGECLFTLSSLFVKNERKLEQLMQDWCKYYAPHRKKNPHVTYFYDATAKFRAYASEEQRDFKDIVIAALQRQGWEVTPVDMGTPMEHQAKFHDINEGLSENGRLSIRFNEENNQDLIVALEHATIKVGYQGFKKDKGGEKLPETETDPLELRTDGTDAWDVLYLGCLYYRHQAGFMTLPRIG